MYKYLNIKYIRYTQLSAQWTRRIDTTYSQKAHKCSVKRQEESISPVKDENSKQRQKHKSNQAHNRKIPKFSIKSSRFDLAQCFHLRGCYSHSGSIKTRVNSSRFILLRILNRLVYHLVRWMYSTAPKLNSQLFLASSANIEIFIL